MLVKLLRAMDRSEFEPTVVTLVNDGALIEIIQDLGIEVRSLDLRRGEVSPRALRRLITILRATRPGRWYWPVASCTRTARSAG